MLTVYEHPLSPYAQKVKLSLYEKGIPFAAVTPNIFQPEGETEFLGSSPRLEVPSLVDGETSVFDSTIILEYIEDKWPEPAMLPATPAERARVRMLEELCDTYVEAISWAIAEIRVFGRAKGDLAERLLARAARQIGGVHAWLERQLGGRPFFNGDAFGWGDLSVWPYVAGYAGMGHPVPAGTRLSSWFERANERDSTRQCSEAVAKVMSTFRDLGPVVESGVFKREYRDHRLEWMVRSGGAEIVLDGLAKGNIRFAVEIE
jgi:glutathione S-transferase/RNA polymerase-associated protein